MKELCKNEEIKENQIIEEEKKCWWENELTDEEKWDLTKRLPKALLAECTVEIHTSHVNR